MEALNSLSVKAVAELVRFNASSDQRFNPPPARACSTKRPAILGSSHGNQHRIGADGEARRRAREGFFKEVTHQIARPVSKNVPRIDATTGRILGARGEGTGLAKAVEKSGRVESAFREMFRGRATQSFGELSRSSS